CLSAAGRFSAGPFSAADRHGDRHGDRLAADEHGDRLAGDKRAEHKPLDPTAVRAKIDERMAAHHPRRRADPEPEAERPALSAADLEAIRWRLDGGTLREVVDDRDALRELGERLDGPLADEVDNVAKAGLLSVRAEVYRLLGELGMAAAASRLALAHAESARDLQSEVIAQAELAHILRLRGDFKEADRLFAKATGSEVPETLRSVVHENAGRCCFDQGRHMEALDHFARAVRLGRPDDTELAARVGVCLEAVYIHVLRDGWGPYPRTREDILGLTKNPALDETTAEQPIIQPR
ncbi:MAG: tetratricopeptide repeat protein, partial [Actinomycetota bacterium]|nr:tetratricopeptide repeat protein [Actinomycetota bacterium]